MELSEYSRLALRTEADQRQILLRLWTLGPQAMRLDNAARGLAGDAGEVSTAVMKFIEYGRPLDAVNLKEEVGDCLWRLNQVCAAAGFTLEEAMVANLAKLAVRYPDKYSDELAANRDKEAERTAVERVGRCVNCGGAVPSVFNYCPSGTGGSACVADKSVVLTDDQSRLLDEAGIQRGTLQGSAEGADRWDDPGVKPGDRSGS